MKKVKAATAMEKSNRSPLAMAVEIAKRVQIRNVRCVEFKGRVVQQDKLMPLTVTYRVAAQTRVDSANSTIIVRANFVMEAKPEGLKEASAVVEASASLDLEYVFPDVGSLDEETIQNFGRINGVYNAWPYWREYVQNAVARMGLPPLVVPVYRIMDAVSKPEASKSLEKIPGRKRGGVKSKKKAVPNKE
jgi:hypothetical protein